MHLNPRIATLLQSLNHASLPGIDLSLERMVMLLAALGNPQRALPPVIHLAGTNGKGSTVAFLRAIYQRAGYRAHAYTSPHLVRFNERMVLANAEIADEQLLPLLEEVAHAAQTIPVTFFEATTAAAFLAFSRNPADVVLLETGLGGRLDATNLVPHPIATVITPIDFDHMEFLGTSLAAIAFEKAGILKTRVPCIIGAQHPESFEAISRVAAEKGAPIVAYGKNWDYESGKTSVTVTTQPGDQSWTLPLPALSGVHQHHNAALASMVAHICAGQLPLSAQALEQGIANAYWPARLQKLRTGPLPEAWGTRGDVYLDGGHNISAARALAQWMGAQPEPITLICGMMARKDAAAFFTPLAKHVAQLFTVPVMGEGECHPPQNLARAAQLVGIANVQYCNSLELLPKMLAGKAAGTLVVAGSLFLAGEILKNHS